MAFKAPKTGVKVKWSKVNVRRVGKSLLPLIIVLAHIISLTELSNRLLLALFFLEVCSYHSNHDCKGFNST